MTYCLYFIVYARPNSNPPIWIRKGNKIVVNKEKQLGRKKKGAAKALVPLGKFTILEYAMI